MERLSGLKIVNSLIDGADDLENFTKACTQVHSAFDAINDIARILEKDDCSNGTKIGYIEDIINYYFGD